MLDKRKEQRVLNVFRERYPEDETLTTDVLVEELSIVKRTAQNYVKELEENGRLVLETKGKPNHWRLADDEPVEPVYDYELARAKRRANKAERVGSRMFMIGVSILAAVGLVTTNSIYSRAMGVYIPLLDADAVIPAVIVGLVGSVIFGVSSIALLYSVILPPAAEWYFEGKVPWKN